MRFLACAVLLLSAAILAEAAVGRNEDKESAQNRYRVLNRNHGSKKAEGRTFGSLFKGCGSPITTTSSFEPSYTTGTFEINVPSSSSTTARDLSDDNDDDDSNDEADNDDDEFELEESFNSIVKHENGLGQRRPSNARQYDYELRFQEEENKRLREEIKQLRAKNARNRRQAMRAQRTQRIRNANSRRQLIRRMNNARRRTNNRRRRNRNRNRFLN